MLTKDQKELLLAKIKAWDDAIHPNYTDPGDGDVEKMLERLTTLREAHAEVLRYIREEL